MPEETRVDVDRLRDIAASIGVLLDEHREQFDKLYAYQPGFGDFEAARWLGDLVTDRRDTILAHVTFLRRALAEITAALGQIAGEIDATDVANAAAVSQVDRPARR
ncbi:hypothetical protein [Actinoplanes sp. NBRC 103695]|uniref:hypothetical protein n=1 Tax=Actinoplanes sp. NBRC 103695 TaxID=3032202 RepID=UPI00255497D1|nr:hypothetical protein [Actinoplanes sp. NBRC 103695]